MPALKHLQLTDNLIKGEQLKIIPTLFPSLVSLDLAGNHIKHDAHLLPLRSLKSLIHLGLEMNPVCSSYPESSSPSSASSSSSSSPSFRTRLFELLPTLVSLDNIDRKGNECEEGEEADDDDEAYEDEEGEENARPDEYEEGDECEGSCEPGLRDLYENDYTNEDDADDEDVNPAELEEDDDDIDDIDEDAGDEPSAAVPNKNASATDSADGRQDLRQSLLLPSPQKRKLADQLTMLNGSASTSSSSSSSSSSFPGGDEGLSGEGVKRVRRCTSNEQAVGEVSSSSSSGAAVGGE
eukprot:GHVT01068272.1.p1 GENE.GHVT01068272.1~~GHVT01068272.1.p1  ORF type:complete len:310 (-),score=102.07 GHVT01068272.1:394-1278(-)